MLALFVKLLYDDSLKNNRRVRDFLVQSVYCDMYTVLNICLDGARLSLHYLMDNSSSNVRVIKRKVNILGSCKVNLGLHESMAAKKQTAYKQSMIIQYIAKSGDAWLEQLSRYAHVFSGEQTYAKVPHRFETE